MSIRSFVVSVCRFLTYPFRKLWQCFCKREEATPPPPAHAPVARRKLSITIPEPPVITRRERVFQREIKSAPVFTRRLSQSLFIDDYFIKRASAKNDKEYHSSEHKKQRIEHRKKLMERLAAEKEAEERAKGKPPTTPTIH